MLRARDKALTASLEVHDLLPGLVMQSRLVVFCLRTLNTKLCLAEHKDDCN